MRQKGNGNLQQKPLVNSLDKIQNEQYELGLDEYIKKTALSLKKMFEERPSLNNFVLSILPSFFALAKTLSVNYKELDPDAPAPRPREYFNALNALKLSVMDEDKNIFPTKIAFYTAVTRWISDALNELYGEEQHKKDNYQFLITPDYSPDINVNPVVWGKDECVAVICLSESSFDDVPRTIFLLCHEIAHYVGERHRICRAQNIFYMISSFWLLNTALCNEIILERTLARKSIQGIMAQEMADFLNERFVFDVKKNHDESSCYRFLPLMEFLELYEYGLKFFDDKHDRAEIIRRWAKKLSECAEPETSEQIKASLSKIEDSLKALYDRDNSGKLYACEVLAARVADQIANLQYKFEIEQLSVFFQYCETAAFAYPEAYADMRMYELIGKETFLENYEGLLNPDKNEELDFGKKVRRDAVMLALFGENNPQENISDLSREAQYIYFIEYITTHKIAEYLKTCHEKTSTSAQIKQALAVFSKEDTQTQENFIIKVIENYEKSLAPVQK